MNPKEVRKSTFRINCVYAGKRFSSVIAGDIYGLTHDRPSLDNMVIKSSYEVVQPNRIIACLHKLVCNWCTPRAIS